jgi:iron-sulfur cluster assembly protein
MPIPFTIEGPAADKLRELSAKAGVEEPMLRIRVVSGGCAGMEYRMDLQRTPPTPKDIVWDFGEGIRVVVDPMTALYVMDSKLVWTESILKTGFSIENPNVKAKCACGQSFTV